jgi:hypothetical protein
MPAMLTELDHVMLAVHDHAPAIAVWQRMGFAVRPVRQLAPMGGGAAGGDGGSAAVLLHSRTPGCANFIEISRADPATAAPALKTLLRGPQGVAMLVHATSSPDALARAWAACGWRSQLIDLRLTPMGPGEPVLVQIVLPEPGQTRLMFNAMQMSSTADFERDEWRAHANTARHWSGITYVERDDFVPETLQLLERLYGSSARQVAAGMWSFRPGQVELVLASESAFRARHEGVAAAAEPNRTLGAMLTIDVDDLHSARRALEAGGLPHAVGVATLLIPASHALGVAIELRAADRPQD